MRDAFSRRRFLACSTAAATLAMFPARRPAAADDRPPVTHPRATSGDRRSEPDWAERLTVTVGPQEADIVGTNHRALQAAVDYVARLGGGTVRVLPGTYVLRNAVTLASHVRLVGSGLDAILTKPASHETKLAADSDWFDQEITLQDARGFQVGDAVCLRTKNPHHGATTIAKRTLVARDGARFKLDRALRENFWLMGDTTVSSLFPLVAAENAERFAIENLTLDGNRAQNQNLDGNYAGCIFLQDCSDVAIRDVVARRYNGDGISWQICHDVVVERCHSHDHAGLGLHPGSGSQRPVMRGNRLERNQIGLFFCWGVKFGLAEDNKLDGNRVGISIGHRDTDNLVRRNEVLRSAEVGVLFRPERGPAFAGHRNRIEENRIVDTGGPAAVAIDVQGATESITLAANRLEETREPAERIAIRLGPDTRDIRLVDNKATGFAKELAP
ncbi:MAG: right-handed parallel beta-helix repeat-containing protein [Pirellulales bacterium]